MSTFDDREKSFEKKFAHDEELEFKITDLFDNILGVLLSIIIIKFYYLWRFE